jgi:CBS domain-containing protein
MTAATLMDPNPKVLHPEDSIITGIEIVMKYRYRRLPVVDAEGIFQGVFGVNCLLRMALPKAVVMEDGLENIHFVRETLPDLRRRLKEVENEPIAMCMRQESIQIAPDLPLLETLRTLYLACASLPVVDPDSGKLLGIISYFDAGEKIMSAEI